MDSFIVGLNIGIGIGLILESIRILIFIKTKEDISILNFKKILYLIPIAFGIIFAFVGDKDFK